MSEIEKGDIVVFQGVPGWEVRGAINGQLTLYHPDDDTYVNAKREQVIQK